jgi:zinc transport system permease protein
MTIADILSFGFIQRALLAGTLIAVLCSLLGVFLVLRRLSLIGDGLAHVTFGSVAVALFLRLNPAIVTLAAIPLVLLSSLGILRLTDRARIYGDAAIGIVSSLGIACGVLIASVAGGFNVDLFSYLFGNILAISDSDMWLAVALFAVVILVLFLFYHDLFAITFDEELARCSGIRAERINTLLVLLTALTVVLAMKLVGIMLISALLILPPVSALQVARSFRGTIVASVCIGTVSVGIGIFASFLLNLPTGGVIVLVNFLIFVLAFAWKRM